MTNRFSISVISIKHRLPLLIGALVLGIILASTGASYMGVKEASLDVGRERLQNLTKQLANLFQQSNNLLLTKTATAANAPAIKAFLQSPSTATRSGASVSLQQLETPEDKNSLQIELWNTNRSFVLSVPEDASPQSLNLDAEFKAAADSPFKTTSSMRVIKGVITAPAVVAVQDDSGKPMGYLVRWRRISISPTPKVLTDLLGSESTLYFGNIQGDLLTNLERITSKPRADLGSSSEVMQYSRDGNNVLALGRPISGTPWFLAIEFPERPLLAPAHRFLKRVLVADLVVFIMGLAGAFVLSRGITQPLQVLTEAASAIGAGSYSDTVDIHREDELGALANAFNAMVTKTQDVQQELERKVQERTADISERKAAEERLKRSLNEVGELKTALDEHAIVAITDPQGKITSVNDKFCAISKYSREELLGQDHRIINSGHHSKEFIRELWTTIARGGVWHGEIKNKAKDGSFYWVDTTIVPFLNEQGKPRQYVAIRADITERKAAEERLKRSLNEVGELKTALDEHAIVAITDPQGKITSVNDKFCAISKYSREELLGQDHRIINSGHHSKEFIRDLWTTIARGRAWHGEIKNKAKDGSSYWVDTTIVPFLNEQGKPRQYVAIRADITERKAAEEQLKLYSDKLERSNGELQDFAQVASHDLQEPLRKILAFGERLKTRAGESLDHESQDYLQRMFSAAARMQTLISDLMTFSRVETKGHSFVRTDLSVIAREVSADLETLIERTGGRVEIEELPTMDADPAQMRQLLQNLIGNALKYYRAGVPPVVRIHSQKLDERRREFITRSGTLAGQLTQILITDNGIGFDEKYLDRIFNMFQRLHSKGEYEGTGVGLAICRKIVDRHNGNITAHSNPGQGTTFVVTMPVLQPKEVKAL